MANVFDELYTKGKDYYDDKESLVFSGITATMPGEAVADTKPKLQWRKVGKGAKPGSQVGSGAILIAAGAIILAGYSASERADLYEVLSNALQMASGFARGTRTDKGLDDCQKCIEEHLWSNTSHLVSAPHKSKRRRQKAALPKLAG